MIQQKTPIEKIGNVFVKRDDLFEIGGVRGGKVRTCWYLAQGATGLITAGSRSSPQVNIVAHIAKKLGIPCRVHTPQGALSPEVQDAKAAGAEVIQHRAGYNSVIVARAHADALKTGYTEIPFGMECQEAVNQTRQQVENLPFSDIKRIVVPVGSGMSLSGILWGLSDMGKDVPVLGIVVGASPEKRLTKYAPMFYNIGLTLQNAGVDYHKEIKESIDDITLDPVYEAKCKKFLEDGDLLWIVGIRKTQTERYK